MGIWHRYFTYVLMFILTFCLYIEDFFHLKMKIKIRHYFVNPGLFLMLD